MKPRVAFIQKGAYEKIGIHYLAGALRVHRIEYAVFIADLEDDVFGELVRYAPHYVVYSLYMGEQAFAFEALKTVKARIPGAKTLVGGPFALIFPEISRRPEIDFVFRGDGENSLPEFIRRMEIGAAIEPVPGLCFTDSQGNDHRSESVEAVDLSRIPRPDRDLYYARYSVLKASPTKMFIASRGCPFGCTFCYNRELAGYFRDPYWRLRPIADVIEEIRCVRDRYGLKWVHFQDGTFNASRKWLHEFLEAYREAGLPPFLCNARVENIDEETVRRLKTAGCDRITFGLQSGNDDIRTRIAGRRTSNRQVEEACRLCRKYGIRTGIDIIFGWPGETVDQAMDTIRLCRRLAADSYSSNVLIFYPRLRVTRYAETHGFIDAAPALDDTDLFHPNRSRLRDHRKRRLINMDKLFYYLIRFPALEKPLMALLRLPPNRLFFFLKNLHLLIRSIRYDTNTSAVRKIVDYLKHCRAVAG